MLLTTSLRTLLFPTIIGLCLLLIPVEHAHAIIIFSNEFLSNEGETAVIDSDGNASGSITLKFGEVQNQTLVWDITNTRFQLSNNLIIDGTLGLNGTTLTLDADNVGAGANVSIIANQGSGSPGTLRYNATSGQWEISNNGGSFIGIDTGGFQSYFREEFMKDIVDLTADGLRTFGDNGQFSVDENTNCTFSILDDVLGGIGRLSIGAANSNCLVYQATAAANAQLIFNTSQTPTILIKARASNAGANDLFWIGLTDLAASNATGPTNGVYFYNNAGANWTGGTELAGAITPIACGTAISATNFALLKIEVLSTSSVRFSVDPNTSDGISFTTCGTSATNIPTTNLGVTIMNHSTTAGRTLDIDYMRVWAN